jgi:hypothetical protein
VLLYAKAKERMRTALGLQGQDAEGASAHELDLFSLARIKSKVSHRKAPPARICIFSFSSAVLFRGCFFLRPRLT